jgi:hypothetical protein
MYAFGAPPARGPASPRPTPDPQAPGAPANTPPNGHDQVAEPDAAAEDTADPQKQARHAAADAASADAAPQGPMGDVGPDPAGPTAIPHQSSIAAGSSRNVGNAVAHVLAARAAAPSPVPDRRGDARDRLLSVLLDDPLRAVGATVDLQDCQERMDRLTGALNDERARLRDVLGRLAHSGLRADQLARLSGLSDSEVAELLRRNKRS